MIDPKIVLTVFCLYMGFLFLTALLVERRSSGGGISLANNPYVYSLSLAVYCTAWTYYGSVGLAATSGLLFLPMYLGPLLCIFLWWIILRKMVRLKNIYRITSIADFVSVRYNKSQAVAAIMTVIAITGITPYVALQLKAIISTFSLITTPTALHLSIVGAENSWIRAHIGPLIVALMILFTIILGVRRLDPTERHEGMMMALAVESVVKLLALLAAGVFVTYFLYDGFQDIFARLPESSVQVSTPTSPASYLTWAGYLVLSMSAILFLPRQFHVAVVENSNEKHILTAMWLLPLYMLLINIFVLPIAVAGTLKGYPVAAADTFLLRLPLDHARAWLPLLVFIGGVSAAAGMIMVACITMATMITNHLLLPLMEWIPRLGFLKRHLLKCRWGAVALFVIIGYWFEEKIGESYMLVNIGLISFTAVLQFAPALLGGIFWRRGNKRGAILGLWSGFAIWCYTLLLPSFSKSGWISSRILEEGPWGITLLRPEHLLGLTGLDPITHAVFWTMIFNISFYVAGSLYSGQNEEEQSLAEEFIGVLSSVKPIRGARPREAYIDFAVKREEIEELLSQYFTEQEVRAMVERCMRNAGIKEEDRISIVQLVELHSEVEKTLGGAIGSAAAYKALHQGTIFTRREARELSEVYGEILADLRVTPSELKRKIDYHQERETLLIRQARELEEKVEELQREIAERRKAQEALRESEERYRRLVESMNEGLAVEDEHGTIIYVNDRLCQMWGCPRESIIGHPFMQFHDEVQRETVAAHMATLKQGEVVSFETTYSDTEGRKLHTIVSCVPMLNLSGEYKGSFSVVTDISELKALEREKDNMISMFAHDMRSSLTGIHGLSLRLMNKAECIEEEKQNQYLQIITKEAGKLEGLVEDLLEFSRLRTGRLKLSLQPFSLEKELLDLYEAYQAKVTQPGIQIELRIESPLSLIEADPNRLRRIFTNLLDNALKFSKDKGTIRILAQENDQEVIVKIADEGIGIDPAELPYIFDLFHRTRSGEKKEGYGIGLATVKAIVQGHGGRVEVSSSLGRGSVFTVFLPKPRKDVKA
ncbi:MAG: PAS domain S-box protein [Syntrophobacteraceae bacterium]|nr:PAS domain S-box protein [Syntrophobacteraceae bacterium]